MDETIQELRSRGFLKVNLSFVVRGGVAKYQVSVMSSLKGWTIGMSEVSFVEAMERAYVQLPERANYDIPAYRALTTPSGKTSDELLDSF